MNEANPLSRPCQVKLKSEGDDNHRTATFHTAETLHSYLAPFPGLAANDTLECLNLLPLAIWVTLDDRCAPSDVRHDSYSSTRR
jgi:hypothetical protein